MAERVLIWKLVGYKAKVSYDLIMSIKPFFEFRLIDILCFGLGGLVEYAGA